MQHTIEKFQHIIFDFDGTLIDWSYDVTPLVIELFKEKLGDKFTEKHLNFISSTQGFAASINAFFKVNERSKIRDEVVKISCGQVDNASIVPDNLVNVLEQLNENHKLYVFSARDPYSLNYAIKSLGINHLFDSISGFDGTFAPKPDASGFLSFIRSLYIKTDQVIYVGDKQPDLFMAQAANVKFIGAGWLRNSLSDKDSRYFCNDLDLLLDTIYCIGSEKIE